MEAMDLDEYLLEQGFDPDELEEDDKWSDRVPTKEDPTFGGARQFGDSNALRKARWQRNNQKKWASQADYFKGREAQHLIPASLAKHYSSLPGILDSVENGMMLPAFASDKASGKIGHRRGPSHRDHPVYTKRVDKLIKAVAKSPNQAQLHAIMAVLRTVNKNKALAAKYSCLDDIPLKEFENAWNLAHPGNTVSL